eukprot:8150571-Heterocapsa_arctica.AAC.1
MTCASASQPRSRARAALTPSASSIWTVVWFTVSSSAVATSMRYCGVHTVNGVSLGAYTAG